MLSWRERFGLLLIVAVAAAARLPGLESRGQFDADQGHDMQVLQAFVRDGVFPLLGPKTSVGEFHHGAAYYYLLGPAAAVSGADPVAITLEIALLGIAAVAVTWWLARAIGGPVAGAIAGLLLALSPGGIAESTFIWNPNPIPFFAALAMAAAWRATSGGRPRWWAVAIGSAGMVTQLHVLGGVFLVAIVATALVAARRARAGGPAILVGLGVVVILFVPLLAHELRTGFLETQRVADYVTGTGSSGGGAPGINAAVAIPFALARAVAWPLTGPINEAPQAAALALVAVVGLTAWTLIVDRGTEAARGARWLLAILLWSTVMLAVAAPSLQTIVVGLPNDHYHAFLDPVVAALVAIGAGSVLERAAVAWRSAREAAAQARQVGRATAATSPTSASGAAGQGNAALLLGGVAGAVVGLLVATEVLRAPAPDVDGGWVAARAAGTRVVEVARAAGSPVLALLGLPAFKPSDGIAFPIQRAGGTLTGVDHARTFVVACDRLFEVAIGADCGGPAEDAALTSAIAAVDGSSGVAPGVTLRFAASPRTMISIYQAPRASAIP